ncbi:hypothetical protein BAVI_16317 [Neobacillus vireti LMG 21834]|uniref:Transposase zinc-ribbon domain-containing protein n=1 Tax=Neobacillus vireti LMG 21834 TaxID=1131730 RepID=A0AB94IKX6_9BACI|nr:hypothetical protein BAVI_16317 [Neobacillus vireti LMG 21834]
MDIETFNWLSAELLNSHQRFIPDPICETYDVKFGDFQTGVRCETCSRFGMIKLPRTWSCPFCNATDCLAHQRTLLEWFLIYKKDITNRECREFLGIEDIHTAKRILQGMNWQSQGTFRNRSYIMNFDNNHFAQSKGGIFIRQ